MALVFYWWFKSKLKRVVGKLVVLLVKSDFRIRK